MARSRKQPGDQAINDSAPDSGLSASNPPEAKAPAKTSARKSAAGKKVQEKPKKVYSWTMLIESRHAKPPEKEPVLTSERGRPRLNVVTYLTSMTLSKGDREAIEFWQEQLSGVLHRKASMGETVGFLARVCQERMVAVGEGGSPIHTLDDLVQLLVAGGE
jgi:hypothetical protein